MNSNNEAKTAGAKPAPKSSLKHTGQGESTRNGHKRMYQRFDHGDMSVGNIPIRHYEISAANDMSLSDRLRSSYIITTGRFYNRRWRKAEERKDNLRRDKHDPLNNRALTGGRRWYRQFRILLPVNMIKYISKLKLMATEKFINKYIKRGGISGA